MKKSILFIAATLIGLLFAVLPLSGLALTNPFLSATNWGPCGDPSTQTYTHFCKEDHNGICKKGMVGESHDGCIGIYHSESRCTEAQIKARINQIGVSSACGRAYRPPGISYAVCVTDLKVYLKHC